MDIIQIYKAVAVNLLYDPDKYIMQPVSIDVAGCSESGETAGIIKTLNIQSINKFEEKFNKVSNISIDTDNKLELSGYYYIRINDTITKTTNCHILVHNKVIDDSSCVVGYYMSLMYKDDSERAYIDGVFSIELAKYLVQIFNCTMTYGRNIALNKDTFNKHIDIGFKRITSDKQMFTYSKNLSAVSEGVGNNDT